MNEINPAVLLQSVRKILTGLTLEEKRMFGGICLLLNGNMLCHASKKGLMVRVGKDQEAAALKLKHFAPCEGAGHAMPGFVIIAPQGLVNDSVLQSGLDMALRYVPTLPVKKPKATAIRTKVVSNHP